MQRPLLAFAMIAGLLGACDSNDSKKSDEAQVAWPAEPSDGTPMAWEFVELTGEGDKRSAKMRMFNFSDKTVTKVQATLHYVDGAGKELDTFPWTQMGPNRVGAKGHKEAKMGAFLPAETKTVTASIESIEYGDGSTWAK
jgi:hypothetical protein